MVKTLLSLIVLISSISKADERAVTLVAELSCPHELEGALIFVRGALGCGRVVKAPIVRQSYDGKQFAVASLNLPKECQKIAWRVLVEEDGKVLCQVAPATITLHEESVELLDQELLLGRISNQRDLARSLANNLELQRSKLQELEAKVDSMASVKNLARLDDLVTLTKEDLRRLSRSVEAAREDLILIKTLPVPRNLQAREAELSKQLPELAAAAQGVSDLGREVLARAAEELKDKLSLIEATRFEQIDRLKRELERLSNERQRIENPIKVEE